MTFVRTALPKLAFALLVFAALPAKAGLYLEPYLGYQAGSYKATVGMITADDAVYGATFGARVGLSLPIFFLAGEYSQLNGTIKGNLGTSTSDFTGTSVFATVGARLPLIRAYAGYAPYHQWKNSSATYKGNAMKVGVGFSGLPFVALNFEYIQNTFDKVDDTAIDFKSTTYMINLSLPLDF